MLVPLATPPLPLERPIRLAIMGSTGSIGLSALELARKNTADFQIVALVAGSKADVLAAQIKEFRPRYAGLASIQSKSPLEGALGNSSTELCYGDSECAKLASLPEVDVVLAAVVGAAGLSSVLEALNGGKRVALANKESLVAGGALVSDACKKGGGVIIPVDSEHSALFQSLLGQNRGDVASLILTASGGPFLDTPQHELSAITASQAVKHPRWNMGAKISVDSATLVNKALELIEASWLFGVGEDRIKVQVHPQSIVHSLVEYVDGTQMAQLSVPDMKGAIAFALTWPGQRLPGAMKPLDLTEISELTFRKLDNEKFPAVRLARAALRARKGAPAVFNIANEAAVGAFLHGKIKFTAIVPTVEEALGHFGGADFHAVSELISLQSEVIQYCNGKLFT